MVRGAILTCSAPCPLTATNKQPRSPFASAPAMGRFGHPITPTWTTLSTMSARQTAYCSPRKKPLVPSIGSSVHMPGINIVIHSVEDSSSLVGLTYALSFLPQMSLDQSHPVVLPRYVWRQVPSYSSPVRILPHRQQQKDLGHRSRVVRHAHGEVELVQCQPAGRLCLLRL
jgi:hypothetical protein